MKRLSNKRMNKINIFDCVDYNLLPFQKIVFDEFLKDQNIFCLKDRQVGLTSLLSLYMLYVINNPESQIIYIGNTVNTDRYVKNLVEKYISKFTTLNGPEVYEKIVPAKNRNNNLYFQNNSEIIFKSYNKDCLRGINPDIVIIDDLVNFQIPKEVSILDDTKFIISLSKNDNLQDNFQDNLQDNFQLDMINLSFFKKIPIHQHLFSNNNYNEIQLYFNWFSEIEELNKENVCL